MQKLALFIVTILAAVSAQAKTYTIDPDHSTVGFKIKHLGAKVGGTFNKFSGTINYDPKSPWSVEAKLDAASIDTNNEKRDNHLRSADFFDVQKCPDITFKSTKVNKLGRGGRATIQGDLTMRCMTKPVTLDLEVGEEVADPWGNAKVAFSAKGKVNRKDFGINWNKALDKGGYILGDEVMIDIEVEAAPSKEEAKDSSKQEAKPADKGAEKKK